MTIVIPAACALLLIGFFVLVARPILSRRLQPAAQAAAHAYLELQHQKELVYAAIKELELDRAVGKIAKDDYEAQHGQLEDSAVDLLHRLEQGEDVDDRASLATIVEQVESDVAALVRSQGTIDTGESTDRFCTGCGAPRAADHRFCPRCGTEFGS